VIIMTGNPQEMSQDIIFQGLMMNWDELKYSYLHNFLSVAENLVVSEAHLNSSRTCCCLLQ
jgi:hypothetical protein